MYGSTPPQVQDLNYEHLVVYGLERSVNDADLRKYFEKFGKVAVAKVSMWCVCVCVFTCMRVRPIPWFYNLRQPLKQ